MIKLPDHTLAEFLTNESIEWNFIPPRSPNHGGLWEAGVKAFKFHLKRVVGNAHLTLEEFITILCEIEAVLNSRPLTPLTSNFDDFETLTPGHFLVGRPLTSIVEPQITNINENQLSRWERVKKITQHIYRLWKRDYLKNLQERYKWKFNKNNVSVGTLVLIKDENLPSTKWSTGRITEIFPGTDDISRITTPFVVKIRAIDLTHERFPLRCYGCGKQGVIKSRCHTCNPNSSQRTDVATNHINAYTAQTRSPQLTLIDITFCGIKGHVCADTGSSHSIAGKRMYQVFKDKGLLFQETTLAMSLVDGQQTTGEALTTQVMVEIEGRSQS
ncbi:integrase catalytic domain-containing protein [Trichonephila clavipes]|nr:integrase catalytic domain-containing protein [Trichonephila clavipes]